MEIGSNIKAEFSFFDKKIEIKHSEFYKVFAHLNNNSFAYTIFDLKNEEFLALESFIFSDEKDLTKIIRRSFWRPTFWCKNRVGGTKWYSHNHYKWKWRIQD